MTNLPPPPKPLREMTNAELAEHAVRIGWSRGDRYASPLSDYEEALCRTICAVLNARMENLVGDGVVAPDLAARVDRLERAMRRVAAWFVHPDPNSDDANDTGTEIRAILAGTVMDNA